MGFDLSGIAPANKVGIYFRNNVWWWRPLWQYVNDACSHILTEEDATSGCFNDGHEISEKKAIAIANILETEIKEGRTEIWKQEREIALALLPKESCSICNGTGQRNDKYIMGECNACHGKGERESFENNYPFDVENVINFIKFCRNSGGFEIC